MSNSKTLYPIPTDLVAPSFFRSVSDKEPQLLSGEEIYAKINFTAPGR